MQSTMHVYEVRPRKDRRGVDLMSDALPFGRLHRIALKNQSDRARQSQWCYPKRLRFLNAE